MIRRPFTAAFVVAAIALMAMLWMSPAFGMKLAVTAERPVIQFPDPRQPIPFEEDPSPSEQEQKSVFNLGVRVVLADAKDRDRVELYDLHADASHDFELARAVTDALDIERSRANVGSEDDLTFSESVPSDVTIKIEGRLVEREDDHWQLSVRIADLIRVAKMYEYGGVELAVCPASVSVTEQATRPADDIDFGDCSTWRESINDSDSYPVVKVMEHPDESNFQLLAAIVGGIAIFFGLVAFLVTRLVQRSHLETLTMATFVVSIAWLGLALVVEGAALIVFGLIDRPITDFVLAHDFSSGQSFLVRALLSFGVAIPFFVPAIALLVCAKSAPPKMQSPTYATHQPVTGAGPGLPSWLGGDSGVPSPAPQQPWTPPPSPPSPSPSPSPRQPPAEEPPSWNPPA